MIRRLRIKFICINMTIVTLMLLVIFGTIFYFSRENLRHQSIQAMELAISDHKRPERPGAFPDRFMLPSFSVMVHPDGSTTLSANDYFDLSDEDLLQDLVTSALSSKEKQGILPKYNLRYGVFRTPDNIKIVFLDISSELETTKSLISICLQIGILSFSAFLVISILLARWAIRPVEAAWNQQKQFVGDASHELKTPLTVIMTNAELLQDTGGNPEQLQYFRNILAVSQQMRGLVERLLELARTDDDTQKIQKTAVNFSKLTEDTLLLFEPVYFEAGLTLESDIQDAVFTTGSAGHLQQVVEILLDNGVKYCAPGGTVRLTLQRQGHRCVLSVSSPGDAISKEDLKNIFKRFYRIDKVRTSRNSFGLGLSIADSIVKKHGGKIWADSKEGINTFFVHLPIRS